MPNFMQYALAAESFFNIGGATVFLLFPEWCLSHVVLPSPTALLETTPTVPASAATLFQVYACLVFGLTVPLLLSIPERRGVATDRKILFKTLGVSEAFIIALLLWKAQDAETSGLSKTALINAAMSLVPYLVWRGWALFVDPKVLGGDRETVGKKTR